MTTFIRKPNERESTYQAKLRIIEVYKRHWHNISDVCEKASISRETFYQWQKQDKEFRITLLDIETYDRDDVEDKLRELIEKNNTRAITFYLSHRHPAYMPNHQHYDDHDNWIMNQYTENNSTQK